ncbi:MAG: hypothetical protein ACX931_02235 [Saccharospirillum sp.]
MMAFVMMVAGYWGLLQYQDKQAREVDAPQTLLVTLQAVSQGETALDDSVIEPDRLRSDLSERIASELVADLTDSGHPDPAVGAQQLLASATVHLQSQDGLLASLERVLVGLGDETWQPLVQQPQEWVVQAGESCLLLAYAGSEPEHYWVWVGLTACQLEESQ